MAAFSLKQEVDELVDEQIEIFKTQKLDGRELFQYHLRHYRIMELYLRIDSLAVQELFREEAYAVRFLESRLGSLGPLTAL